MAFKYLRDCGDETNSRKLKDYIFEINKVISYLKVGVKNNLEAGKKLFEFYSKEIKPNETNFKNYQETQAVFENLLNELSGIIYQINSLNPIQASSANSLLNKGIF